MVKSLKISEVLLPHTETAKAIVNNAFNILSVDDRGSFIKGDNYPNLIPLSTILNWGVKANHINNEYDAIKQVKWTDQIKRDNDATIISLGGLLADYLEMEVTTARKTRSKSPIGRFEKELLISRLRIMSKENNFSDLAGINNFDYSLEGKKLYQHITANLALTDDYLQQGGVWYNLVRDAPNEWRTRPGKIGTSPAPASLDQSEPAAKMAMLEVMTSVTEVGDIKALDGSPTMTKGRNSRKRIVEWVQWQARHFVKTGDTTNELANKIWLEANRWGIESERGLLSKASILKMLPPGITGGRSKNMGKSKK